MPVHLSWESYVCDPRPHYPLLISAKRYWDASATGEEDSEDTPTDEEGLTLILAHGAGHHKEQWEPTLERLFELDARNGRRRRRRRRRIKEAWSIDCPNHGDAAVLNAVELEYGYSPMFDWQEYARSINIFVAGKGRGVNVDFSKRRLVAVGHSMGAAALILVGTYDFITSPFESVILVDPMIKPPEVYHEALNLTYAAATQTEKRQDIWPSRADALASFRSKSSYKTWNPRALELYVEHGLQDLPATGYPPDAKGVALKCQKQWDGASYRPLVGHIRAYKFLHVLCEAVPVHILYGAIGNFLPREVHNHVLTEGTRGKHKSHTFIEGAGHMVPQMQPIKLAEEIFAVLPSVPRQASTTRLSSKL